MSLLGHLASPNHVYVFSLTDSKGLSYLSQVVGRGTTPPVLVLSPVLSHDDTGDRDAAALVAVALDAL